MNISIGRKSFICTQLPLVIQLLAVSSAGAATVSWDGGGGDNSWHTAANWSGNVLPGPNDDVVIDLPGEITVVQNS